MNERTSGHNWRELPHVSTPQKYLLIKLNYVFLCKHMGTLQLFYSFLQLSDYTE